ncbi:hypothetical protein IK146_03450 [Candidatus Saccharibacteria bacterium]|nr:hypothetical protein [Candidatus Saccharibacteria bacterium]
MSTHVYQIIDGPNRNDFVMSFLYACDADIGLKIARYKLQNQSEKKKDVSILLQKISHENGSGSYMFEGFVYHGFPGNKMSVQVKGHYDAQKRTGHVTTVDCVGIPF